MRNVCLPGLSLVGIHVLALAFLVPFSTHLPVVHGGVIRSTRWLRTIRGLLRRRPLKAGVYFEFTGARVQIAGQGKFEDNEDYGFVVFREMSIGGSRGAHTHGDSV